MIIEKRNDIFPVETLLGTMSNSDYRRFSKFIRTECGIKMPDVKKTMLESRLQKRIKNLSMKSYSEYCNYVFSPKGMKNELIHMIDAVTTNKTEFFREPSGIDYVANIALEELVETYGSGIRKKLMLWSAGCSSGEEPYTLAMVLNEFAERSPGFQFTIIATDISTKVLEIAKRAVYECHKIDPIPMRLKKKYLMRSKDKNKRTVRIVPGLRSLVKFRRLNFMEGDFGMREPMDIIFCRNVLIYFDRATQEKLLNRLCYHLTPGGYIVLGGAESLNGLDVPLIQMEPTVYRKQV